MSNKAELLEQYNAMINEAEKLKDKIDSIKEPEFEYPMFFKFIGNNASGMIVRFDSIGVFTAITSGVNVALGDVVEEAIPHTDTDCWKQIPHCYINGELYYDKQPVYAWKYKEVRGQIRFIDAKNKHVFSIDGERQRFVVFDNYAPYHHDDEWIKKYQEQLED